MNGIKYRKPEEMKDSGIEWLGMIPSKWKVVALKRGIKVRNGRELFDDDKDIAKNINVYGSGGIFKYTSGYLHDGESVLFGRKGTIGKPLYVKERFWTVDTMYYTTFEKNKYFPKFAYYMLLIYPWNVITTQTALPSVVGTVVESIKSIMPDVTEQQKIANFLDIKTAQFDSIIAMKEHLIQKLEEAKKSLISEVVTGKVKIMDGDIVPRQPEEMKESGVEWLGMIPKDWEIKKIKHIADVKGRIGFRGYTKDDLVDEDEGALALGATHITVNGIIDVSAPIYIKWKKYFESPEIMLNKGDLLLVQRGSVGRVGIVEDLPKEATINPSLMIIKNFEKVTNRYLFYFLKSVCIEAYFNSITSNTAVPMISQAQALNTWLAIPEVFTQKNIGSFLDIKTAQFDSSIAKNKMLIQKLKQAKQSLISEAVTGKIDLRDWEIMEVGEVQ